ncbi:DUF2242 domain-containing protein, partial [Methylobacterium sp. WL19]
ASPEVRRAASHPAPSGANPVRAVRAPAARSAEAAPVDPWGPVPAPAPVSRGWW